MHMSGFGFALERTVRMTPVTTAVVVVGEDAAGDLEAALDHTSWARDSGECSVVSSVPSEMHRPSKDKRTSW